MWAMIMFYLFLWLVMNTDHKLLPNDFYQILKPPWKMRCSSAHYPFYRKLSFEPHRPCAGPCLCLLCRLNVSPIPLGFPTRVTVVPSSRGSPILLTFLPWIPRGLVNLYNSTSGPLAWMNDHGVETVSFRTLHLKIIVPVEGELTANVWCQADSNTLFHSPLG